MPKITVVNQEGKALHKIDLAEAVFGVEPKQQAVFDTLMMQRAAMRQGTHDVKNRWEVSGGGRKPWRQKGTGRARQGSIRSPQWRGGGVVFGPTPRSYAVRINRKVRRLAVRSVLSEKLSGNALVVVDQIKLASPKTKDFVAIQNALKLERNTLFVFNSQENWENTYLSSRNLPNVIFTTVEGLNLYDMMRVQTIVFTEAAAKTAGEVLA
jgi:large subunit ribosomal protein L4